MEWTKIPTDLLQSRKSDKEILAITKYQLLWAMLERQPDDETSLRYMTSKQLQQARDYLSAIKQQVCADIKSVTDKRKRDKIFYAKKQSHNKDSDILTDARSDELTDKLSAPTDKIREDKIREEKKIQEEKNREIIQPIFDKLKNIITNRLGREVNTRSWKNHIRLMIEQDRLNQEEILTSLDWYEKHIGEQFIPVIQSAESLRKKYGQLEEAIKRNKPKEWVNQFEDWK